MAGRIDYKSFHDVFGNGDTLPYDQHVNRDIESKRKSLGGVLFVDRVFTALGISKVKMYPPKDTRALHELYQQILGSKMTAHHKLSALYYLLLDHDEGMSARSKLSETFALQTGMPKRYQIFMSGLWHMDRLQFGIALEYLAHPSLLPEFADNIITVLVRHAEDNDYSLALAYYAAVQPVLTSPEAVALLFEALARTDVTEAFFYTRTRADPAPSRQQLFERLVVSVLKESTAGGLPHLDTAGRSAELIGLPLDAQEEAWLRAFLTTGEGRKLKRARDTLIMKSILAGDLGLAEAGSASAAAAAAASGESASGASAAGSSKALSGPWGIILQGFRHGTATAGSGGGGGSAGGEQ